MMIRSTRRSRAFNSVAAHSRSDRMAKRMTLVFLLLVAAVGLLAAGGPAANSNSNNSKSNSVVMVVDALFLMTSSHHRRRPPSSSRARNGNGNGKYGAGPTTTASPLSEPNTKRRTTESRSASSPLIVFYGMVVGRPGGLTLGHDDNEVVDKAEVVDKVEDKDKGDKNNYEDDDEFFSKDMIQRKREFEQRYEHFRGRGRWGGYSLSGIPHESQQQQPQRAPLPVVSTTTATTTAPTKPMKGKRVPRRTRARAPPMLKITDIQQYKKEVVDSEDSALVVVRFYASWCKACKAIESNYHRLPQEFPSTVKFVEVALTKDNAYMMKGLDIPSLPFAHVYYNADHEDNNDHNAEDSSSSSSSSCTLVEELKINKNKFSDFRRTIRSYVNRECDAYYSSSSSSDNNKSDDNIVTVLSSSPHRQTSNDATTTTTMKTKTYIRNDADIDVAEAEPKPEATPIL